MKNQKNSMHDYVENKVLSMSAPELRLTAHLASEELNKRRSNWVREMFQRFNQQSNTDMAYATIAYGGDWNADRIIVNRFKDKGRSKVATGVARLSPGDNFDYNTGVAIAFARAMGEPVPDLF